MNDFSKNEQETLRKTAELEEEYQRLLREMPPSSYELGISLSDYYDEMESSKPLGALLKRIGNLKASLVPREQELRDLPRWALVALAGRCARRLLPSAQQCVDAALLTDAIDLIENQSTQGQPLGPVGPILQTLRNRRSQLPVTERTVAFDTILLNPPGYYDVEGIEQALEGTDLIINGDKQKGISLIASLCQRFTHPAPSPIGADYRLLARLTMSEGWTDNSPVAKWVWASFSTFDLQTNIDGRSILDVSSFIDRKLMQHFRQHPDELYNLNPRNFEELVAELFQGFGFDVELTAQTRDQGRDIIAIAHKPANIRFLIECKRYAAERAVGIAPVQRLFGVVTSEQATKGILVTTARRFSQPAGDFINKHKWILEGREFGRLVEWLEMYEQFMIRPPNFR